jgi:Ca2+/H+ antiporter
MMQIASDLMVWRVLGAILITVNGATTFSALRQARGSQRRVVEYTTFFFATIVILMTPYLVPYMFGAQRAALIARVYVPIAYAVALVLTAVYIFRVVSQRTPGAKDRE